MIRPAVFFALALIVSWSNAAACDIYDRACWEAKRARVVNPDSTGQNLMERNKTCQDILLKVEDVAQQVLRHLYARDQVFSPTGRGVDYDNPTGGVGYIDHGSVQMIEREITMIVNVAIRDVRMVRYDGANLNSCAEITNLAKDDILSIRDALP